MTAVVRATSSSRVLLALLLVAAALVFSRGAPWWGEPSRTVAWVAGMVVGVAPLVAGCTAVDVARWSRPEVRDALRVTPLGGRARLPVLLGNAAVAVALLLVLLAAAVGSSAAAGHGWPRVEVAAPVVTAAIAAMLAGVAVGAAVGAGLPPVVAGPVAALLGYALSVVPALVPAPEVLRGAAPTGSLVGIRANAPLLLTSAAAGAALLALAVLVVAALDAVTVGGLRRAVLGAVGALAGLTLVAGTLQARQGAAFEASSAEVETSCAGQAPEVCVPQESTVDAATLADELEHQAVALRRAGAAVPGVFELPAASRSVTDDRGVVVTGLGPEGPAGLADDAAYSLATPRDCPQLRAETAPSADVVEAHQHLVAWLLLSSGRRTPDDLAGSPAATWWATTDAATRDGWVRTTYAALRECRFDDVRAP